MPQMRHESATRIRRPHGRVYHVCPNIPKPSCKAWTIIRSPCLSGLCKGPLPKSPSVSGLVYQIPNRITSSPFKGHGRLTTRSKHGSRNSQILHSKHFPIIMGSLAAPKKTRIFKDTYPKGPRTQIKGLWGPNTINVIVFGP